MLAVQLNLCVGAGAPSIPLARGSREAHSITSVPQRHKKCAATGGTHSFFMRPKGALFAYYILSGTVMLSTVSTFLIVFFAARQRAIRASISAQSSQRQRQAL